MNQELPTITSIVALWGDFITQIVPKEKSTALIFVFCKLYSTLCGNKSNAVALFLYFLDTASHFLPFQSTVLIVPKLLKEKIKHTKSCLLLFSPSNLEKSNYMYIDLFCNGCPIKYSFFIYSNKPF